MTTIGLHIIVPHPPTEYSREQLDRAWTLAQHLESARFILFEPPELIERP